VAGTGTAERPSALDLEHQAADADAAASDLESRALDHGEPVDLAEIDGHRERARGLRFRATAAQRQAERDIAAARLADLAQLHADIIEYAGSLDPAALPDALGRVKDAAAEVRRLAAAHDAKVRELAERARVLGAGGSAPGGPRAEHGHVAFGGPGMVTAGAMTLRAVGSEVDGLPPSWAQHDDPRLDLIPVPSPVTRRDVQRPAHLLVSASGTLITAEDTARFRRQFADGSLTELTGADIDAWMAGTLDLAGR
jgi:hypothetical protein